ncbi:MAG: fatty-acid--CoA ligase [Mycolicibacterium cosmeticum]|nr:fatty-acid--CoA ligase [Mycolicibacterium cosmeticum]
MGEYHLHSLILAADYRVDDPESMWNSLKGRQESLANIDAHHVVLYTSIWEPGRILVTIGVSHPNSVREVLRSPAIFDLFDISGVDDIPAIFAGEVVEKIDLFDPEPGGTEEAIAAVIVGVVTTVDSVEELMDKLRGALDRFRESGVRKIWVYHAFDDGHEVLILQEIENETSARRWIDHPDAAAEWMSRAGFGAYPSLFVGKFAHLMTVGV